MYRSTALTAALAASLFVLVACKNEQTPNDDQPKETTAQSVEATTSATTQDANSDTRAAAKSAAEDSPEFEVREYERGPYAEEFLQLEVFWNDEKAMLAPCMEPQPGAKCKRKGVPVTKGAKLEFDKSHIHVTPRVLTAKTDMTVRLGNEDVQLKAGDPLALYVYQGEGVCALATPTRYDEASVCPSARDFDNFPDSKGGTAMTLQPEKVDWWVHMSDGWVNLDLERVRVEKSQTEP
jgi:hypothetical protein